jgi:hypothetical protein
VNVEVGERVHIGGEKVVGVISNTVGTCTRAHARARRFHSPVRVTIFYLKNRYALFILF